MHLLVRHAGGVIKAELAASAVPGDYTFAHRPSQPSLFPARRALVIRPDGACRSAQDPQMPPRLRAIAACATWGAINQT
jgi:hypothetical protein